MRAERTRLSTTPFESSKGNLNRQKVRVAELAIHQLKNVHSPIRFNYQWLNDTSTQPRLASRSNAVNVFTDGIVSCLYRHPGFIVSQRHNQENAVC